MIIDIKILEINIRYVINKNNYSKYINTFMVIK